MHEESDVASKDTPFLWLEGLALLATASLGTIVGFSEELGRLAVPAYWPGAVLAIAAWSRTSRRPWWPAWAIAGHLLVLLLPLLVVLALSVEDHLFRQPNGPPSRAAPEGNLGGLFAALVLGVAVIMYLPLLGYSVGSLWRLFRSGGKVTSWRPEQAITRLAGLAALVGIGLHLIPPAASRYVSQRQERAHARALADIADRLVRESSEQPRHWEQQVAAAVPGIIPSLSSHLDDPNPSVRRRAARALATVNSGQLWPLPEQSPILQMEAHLVDADPEVRANLVLAIAKHGRECIQASHQAELLSDRPMESKRFYAEQLACARLIPIAMRDSDPMVRAVGFTVAIERYTDRQNATPWPPPVLLKPEFTTAFAEQLAGPEANKAVAALRGLGPSASTAAVALHRYANSDVSSEEKASAAIALGVVEPRSTTEAVSLLEPLLPHLSGKVLYDTAQFIAGASPDHPALPQLAQRIAKDLNVTSAKLRRRVIETLGVLGPQSQAVLPQLDNASRIATDVEERDALLDAMRRIRDAAEF